MTKEEQYAFVMKEMAPKIKTWADLYDFFEDAMKRVKETAHPAFVFDSLFTMYAFFHAMKELPEEGDITVLVERMFRIMAMDCEEKLGVKLSIMRPEDMQKEVSDTALSSMISFAQATPPAGGKMH